MSRPFRTRPLQFYLTAPGPCPYLPRRRERKVFAHLDGPDSPNLNDALTGAGFRRSQSIIYRPACDDCDACVSARVPVDQFVPSRNQRRVLNRNADLRYVERPPSATDEQFALLNRYLNSRHGDGGMAGMSFGDYALMVSDTPTDTVLGEYRDAEGGLAAAVLLDRLADGVSLVYSFFEPEQEARSLGTFIILDQIRRAGARPGARVYLGYWISGSRKMAYKARFRPLEVLRHGGWRVVTDAEVEDGAQEARED